MLSEVALPAPVSFTEESKAQEDETVSPSDSWGTCGLFLAFLWHPAHPPSPFLLLRPHLLSLRFCPKSRSRHLSFTACHEPLSRRRRAASRCVMLPSEHLTTLFVREGLFFK